MFSVPTAWLFTLLAAVTVAGMCGVASPLLEPKHPPF